jgi:hypothetical protein
VLLLALACAGGSCPTPWRSPLPLPGASLRGPDAAVPRAPLRPVDGAPATGRFRVWLLTMDRGDEVYEMFGHNALLIEDARTGQALAWNWGLFNFEDVDFIPRFLRGTMRYSMGPADPEPFLRSYRRRTARSTRTSIHLTQAQAAELDAFVRWNFLPENRPYIYDYYRDNCSTRLRDALDLVLGGQIAPASGTRPTGRSYRWYSRQLVQVTGWVDQGLSFLLGMRGDRTHLGLGGHVPPGGAHGSTWRASGGGSRRGHPAPSWARGRSGGGGPPPLPAGPRRPSSSWASSSGQGSSWGSWPSSPRTQAAPGWPPAASPSPRDPGSPWACPRRWPGAPSPGLLGLLLVARLVHGPRLHPGEPEPLPT